MRILFQQNRAILPIPAPSEGTCELAVVGTCPCCTPGGELRVRGLNPELGPAFGEVSADAACAGCGMVLGRLHVSEEDGLARLDTRARVRVTEALARLPFFEQKRHVGA